MSEFIHFSDIDPLHPTSWISKKILSIDIDWASDEVLTDNASLLEEAGVKVCFFVTHNAPLLSRLRASDRVELGLHPNFDPLLRGEAGGGTAADIIEEVRKLVPGARVLRGHSMTTSGRWLDVYKSAGITHLSNYFMFGVNAIRPFFQVNGLMEVPVYFADDGYLYLENSRRVTFDIGEESADTHQGLRVYNFHPIHVFLNTEHLDRYERTRHLHHNPEELIKHRYEGVGTRTRLVELLKLAESVGSNNEQT